MKNNRLLFLLALALLASPALAIGPGVDLWGTPGDGKTFVDFSAEPIPAGFFCAGGAPFDGRIEFRGVQVAGAPNHVDTVVERLDEADFNERGVAVTRTRVRAIQLEGLAAISTSCGAYHVRVALAPGEQPLNRMRIKQINDEGGTFTANLALTVRMTFTPVGRRAPARTFDHTIVFERPARFPWARTTDSLSSSREMMIDTNGDGRVDTRVASRSEFIAGLAPGSIASGGAFEGAAQAMVASDITDAELIEYHIRPTHAHQIVPICDGCAEP